MDGNGGLLYPVKGRPAGSGPPGAGELGPDLRVWLCKVRQKGKGHGTEDRGYRDRDHRGFQRHRARHGVDLRQARRHRVAGGPPRGGPGGTGAGV
ncbi:protein of unknown function [Candidatus Methylocalor cossyra]|uniref:Uncharacterized protein n=1 Tax=Candidatus Methylocalor cossyra TaxID=3108543 RepID=A0ABP1C7C1_9GAMM